MPVEVKPRKNEPLDRVIRRLKKKIDREDIIHTFRENRYFKKPSALRRKKEKIAKFNNMLRLRYQNM
jgi:small subunit ribosomal protein S21